MVPNDWETRSLDSIVDAPIRYGVVQIGENVEDGVPIVPIKFINSIETSPLHKTAKNIESKYINSRIKGGDVLISIKGTIGAVGLVPSGFEGNIAREIARIRPSKNYDSSYVLYQLQSDFTQKRIQNLTVGSTRKEFSIHTIKRFSIDIPPLPEQRKIAQILSTWDKAITTTEKLIDASKQQKKALMQQLLTGKKRLVDPETGKAFEADWENVSLKKLISEVKKTKEIEPNIIELLTVKLHHKGVKASGKYPNATKGGRPYYKRYTGELIIGRQNLHNGGIAIVTEECDGLIASNAISSFEVTSIADVQFILNKMSTAHFIYTIDNLTGGTGQKEISVKELLKIKISTPSITEQKKIASVLTAADKEIELLVAKLIHLKQEKKALMQQLLTGKRRVKVPETEAA
ncbi:TPA: restriction endonuclease subunit S [Vibrio parahaemolyticus]|uniref:restriction endonuclease subunit S n=1 Tax=Vibrio parahaemolyticus TaxID=670 RepID=UPI0023601D4A|nr:restriction endonuclease subunit S [Vibrio parahaemolyticus]HCH6176322.1 restriction endonuclease subunit S [Vibrio parahaemolyticus]HCH6569459.1 restriction endonuclease subunit S [Vibrio parahaemolyticus]